MQLEPEDAFHALSVQNLPQLIAQAEQRGKQRALQNMLVRIPPKYSVYHNKQNNERD